MKLSDDLRKARADRPDEYTMDRFIREAEMMERILMLVSKHLHHVGEIEKQILKQLGES